MGKHHHGPHHHNHKVIYHEEFERAIKELGERLISIGEKFKENGQLEINGNSIKPSELSNWDFIYEQRPGGEFVLKIEIEWDEDNSRAPASTEPGVIK